MSIRLTNSGVEIPVKFTTFPAGETCVRIPEGIVFGTVDVWFNFEGNKDLFDLALVMDAARRYLSPHVTTYNLIMPYLPYARQDRVCNVGESLSVKVVADFINGLGFASVHCKDIHSSVGVALINNLVHETLETCADSLCLNRSSTILVSPDAGANKKVLDYAKAYGFPEVVRADKTRDVLTGKITGTVVYSEHVGNKDFLILDDICDGGRTFIELAKELRKLTDGKIMLYVTHGIFSAGTKVLAGIIDHVYTSNPVGATGVEASKTPFVTVI